MLKYTVITRRLRPYHYTRDLVEGGFIFIVVRYIPALEEQADILTKEYVGKNIDSDINDFLLRGVGVQPEGDCAAISDDGNENCIWLRGVADQSVPWQNYDISVMRSALGMHDVHTTNHIYSCIPQIR